MSDDKTTETWRDRQAKDAKAVKEATTDRDNSLQQAMFAGSRQSDQLKDRISEMEDEIDQLRALVTRLTNVADDLARRLSDPGSEALAAIHCGRHFIYG